MDLEYVLRKFKRIFIKQIKQIINLFGLEIIKLIDYKNMQKEIKKLQEKIRILFLLFYFETYPIRRH